MKKHNRIFDANINRSSEGLRVLEDIARLECGIVSIATRLKNIRHGLRSVAKTHTKIYLDRDVSGDIGIAIEATDEFDRPNVISLVSSNSARVCEALRVVEEVSKFLNYEDVARKSAGWRYDVYKIQKSLLQILQHKNKQWSVCLLLTRSQCVEPWEFIAQAAFKTGVDAIQIREPDMDTKTLLKTTEALLALRKDRPTAIIVNNRLDVALASGADGVHLGTSDLPVSEARRLAGESFIVGATAHTFGEGVDAVRDGASYVGLGSIFQSSTKPTIKPVGTKLLDDFIKNCPRIPHLAIGGISFEKMPELLDTGVCGVALSGSICSSLFPEKEMKKFIGCFGNKKENIKLK